MSYNHQLTYGVPRDVLDGAASFFIFTGPTLWFSVTPNCEKSPCLVARQFELIVRIAALKLLIRCKNLLFQILFFTLLTKLIFTTLTLRMEITYKCWVGAIGAGVEY